MSWARGVLAILAKDVRSEVRARSALNAVVLFTVVTFRDLPRIKQLVRALDPAAFVVVTDTLEVMGHRMGNQPHW